MPHRPLLVAAVCTVIALGGCRSSSAPTSPPANPPADLTQQQSAAAADYIAAIQSARTPAAEADAIRALRKWEIANGLTYRIRPVRGDTNTPAPDPSTLPPGVPVRAEVTLFRGRDTIRTFTFTPKDNRNLALFGE